METILFARLKVYLCSRLETPTVVIDDSNYISILTHIAEYVENMQGITLSGPEKRTLVIGYYRKIIGETSAGPGVNYPSAIYPPTEETKPVSASTQAKLIHFVDFIAGQVLDAIVNATRGHLNINTGASSTAPSKPAAKKQIKGGFK